MAVVCIMFIMLISQNLLLHTAVAVLKERPIDYTIVKASIGFTFAS